MNVKNALELPISINTLMEVKLASRNVNLPKSDGPIPRATTSPVMKESPALTTFVSNEAVNLNLMERWRNSFARYYRPTDAASVRYRERISHEFNSGVPGRLMYADRYLRYASASTTSSAEISSESLRSRLIGVLPRNWDRFSTSFEKG